jgi:hypothetical protein
MKQRKEPQPKSTSTAEKTAPKKSVQELTALINKIVENDPKKATFVVESWIKNPVKVDKKAS